MPAVTNPIVQWMIQSSWFHKYNGMIGGFCAGLWVQAKYWREIKATLEAWGIPTNDYMSFLLLIVAASGLSVSVVGTLFKSAQNKQEPEIPVESQETKK